MSDETPPSEQLMDGKFRLRSLLGSGGMCTVYEAEQLNTGRTVAIKVLNSLGADPATIKRFRREAQILGKLSHPNIMSVYSIGITEDKQPYLVVEVLQGTTLADLLAAAPDFSWQRCYNIMSQICEGVSYAHSQGVIHRDLKPSNIMISPGADRVRILDFGIASFSEAPPEQRLTQTGVVFGTPAYMSPEQCAGMRASERSDVYSLGCILFELCTGQPPFIGDNVLEIMYKQINQPLPKFNPVDPATPSAVLTVIEKALAKQEDERYQSVAQMAKELARVNQGARVAPPGRRRRLGGAQVVAVFLGMTLVLSAVAALSLPQSRRVLDAAIHRIFDRPAPAAAQVASTLQVSQSDQQEARKLADLCLADAQRDGLTAEALSPVLDHTLAAELYYQSALRLIKAGSGDQALLKSRLNSAIDRYDAAIAVIDSLQRRDDLPLRLRCASALEDAMRLAQADELAQLYDRFMHNISPLLLLADGETSVEERLAITKTAMDVYLTYPQFLNTRRRVDSAMNTADSEFHAVEHLGIMHRWPKEKFEAEKKRVHTEMHNLRKLYRRAIGDND